MPVDDPSIFVNTPMGSPQPSPAQATGIGEALQRFSENLINLKAVRQNQAAAELQRNLSAANMGFPVDPSHVEKLMKRAGIRVNAEGAQASIMTKQQGQNPQPQMATSQGNQLAVPQQPQGQTPKQLSPQEQRAGVVNAIIQRAVGMAKARNDSQETQARIAAETASLKEKALNGDKQALGRLQAIGDIPFDLHQTQWAGATDQQRAAMIDIAAGHESQAQLMQRAQGITDSLISTGRLTDPQAASRAGRILAEGGQLPPDLQKAMKPFTMSELVDQAKLSNELINAGVPTGQLGRVMAAAQTGGIANALPTGLKPIVLQELDMRRQEVGLQAARLGIEKGQLQLQQEEFGLRFQQAQTAAKKLDIELQKEENKGLLEQLQGLVQAKKAGADIPQPVLDGYIGKIAKAANLTPVEAKHWWQYVTGGSYTTYQPIPDMDLVKSTAGAPQTESQGGKKTTAGDVATSVAKNLPATKMAEGAAAFFKTPAGQRVLHDLGITAMGKGVKTTEGAVKSGIQSVQDEGKN